MLSFKKPSAVSSPKRADFPILRNNQALVYLDTAASAQKPDAVLRAMSHVAETYYANIHRGIYKNSQVTTDAFERARETVSRFINAPDTRGVIFTRNTTEAINLVASSWGRAHLKAGDEIILSAMEHHANIVPWQMLRDEIGIEIKIIPLKQDCTLDLEAYEKLLSPRTKLVSVVHISNGTGVINDVKTIITKAKTYNPQIITLVDASQSVVHSKVDMQSLGCDFLAFTGHKLYGPTGVGVLAGKYEILEALPPYQGGGDMIETVTWDKTTFRAPPARFEAGTPAILEVIGLAAAIDYLGDNFYAGEDDLSKYTFEKLSTIEGLTIYGSHAPRIGIFSMNFAGVHPTDVAEILNQQNIAVRSGHHCCMPLMQALGVTGTFRASLGLYNIKADIDKLVEGLIKAKGLLS
ncbi:MAG: SufS family cysteine desulfurase [Alphaproteobacteria bacterium]|nr:SufS family cysteine desulfurase [Alphaproteobacteria bacterium]